MQGFLLSEIHHFSNSINKKVRSKLTALFISLWIGPKVIKRLQILKFGQEVRNDGPESHFAKKGTPTMGRKHREKRTAQ